jgi:hypothetical protein
MGSRWHFGADGLGAARLRHRALSPSGCPRLANLCMLRLVATGGELFIASPVQHGAVFRCARRRDCLRFHPKNRSDALGSDSVYFGSAGAGFGGLRSRRTGVAARLGLCAGQSGNKLRSRQSATGTRETRRSEIVLRNCTPVEPKTQRCPQ